VRAAERDQRRVPQPGADVTITVDVGPIVDGDLVSARWTMRATYAGGLAEATAPVGTEIAFSGHDILRVSGDRFVEYWTCTDVLDGFAQLGAIAGPNGPARRFDGDIAAKPLSRNDIA
jgi:predicted ester cyclase